MGGKYFEKAKKEKQAATMNGKFQVGDAKLAHLNPVQQNQQQAPQKYRVHEEKSIIESFSNEAKAIQNERERFADRMQRRNYQITRKALEISEGWKIKDLKKVDKERREGFFRAQNEMNLNMAEAFVEKRNQKAQQKKQNNPQVQEKGYEQELTATELWEVMTGAVAKTKKTDMEKTGNKGNMVFEEIGQANHMLSADGLAVMGTALGLQANPQQKQVVLNDDQKRLTAVLTGVNKLAAAAKNGMTEKDIKDMIELYKGMGLTSFAFSARFMDDTLTKMPAEAQIILYHCFFTALKDSLDSMEQKDINLNSFADLIGAVEALDQTANELIQSEHFQKEYAKENKDLYDARQNATDDKEIEWFQKETERRKTETDQEKEKKIEEAIEEYFKTFASDKIAGEEEEKSKKAKGKAQKDKKAPIAEKIKWIGDDEYKSLLKETVNTALIKEEKMEGLYFIKEILIRRIYFLSERLNNRLAEVYSVVQGKTSIHHNIPAMREWMCNRIVKEKRNLITGNKEIEENDVTALISEMEQKPAKGATSELYEEAQRYQTRIDLIANALEIPKDGKEAEEAWKAPEITALLMRTAEKGKEAEVQTAVEKEIDEIKKQYDRNMEHLESRVENFCGPLYKREGIALLKKKFGIRIAFSAPAPMIVAANNVLENLGMHLPHVTMQLVLISKEAKDAGIPKKWIYSAMLKMDQDAERDTLRNPHGTTQRKQRKSFLKRFAKDIKTNIKAFDEKTKTAQLTEADWKYLLDWKNEHITEADFGTKFQTQLNTLSGKQSNEKRVLMEEYLYQKHRPTENVQKEYNDEIKGSELAKHAELDAFVGEQSEEIFAHFNQMIAENRFKDVEGLKEFTSLAEIKSTAELGVLPYRVYQRMLEYVRNNLKDAKVLWDDKLTKLAGQVPADKRLKEIKRMMLAQMMEGKLNTEQLLSDEFDRCNTLLTNMEEVQKERFNYRFANRDKKAGRIHYKVGEGTLGGSVFSNKEYKPRKKNEKFRYAEQAWDKLTDETRVNLIKAFRSFMADFKAKNQANGKWKLKSDKLKKEYEKKTKAFADSLQGKSKDKPKFLSMMTVIEWDNLKNAMENLNIVNEVDSSKKIDVSYFIREMMMLQTEEFVFSSGCEGENEFLYGNSETYYNKMLDVTDRVLDKASAITGNLSMQNQEKAQALFNVRELMADLGSNAEKNKEKYGVSDWQSVIDKVEKVYVKKDNNDVSTAGTNFTEMLNKLNQLTWKVGNNAAKGLHEIDHDTNNKVMESYLTSRSAIRTNGVKMFEMDAFKAMIPYLMKSDEHWGNLAVFQKANDEAKFYQYMKVLMDNIAEPLLLLQNKLQYGDMMAAQRFADQYHDDILKGTCPADKKDWTECVNDFYNDVFKKRFVFDGKKREQRNTKYENINIVRERIKKIAPDRKYFVMERVALIIAEQGLDEYYCDTDKLTELAKVTWETYKVLNARFEEQYSLWINQNEADLKKQYKQLFDVDVSNERWEELKKNIRDQAELDLIGKMSPTIDQNAAANYTFVFDPYKTLNLHKKEDLNSARSKDQAQLTDEQKEMLKAEKDEAAFKATADDIFQKKWDNLGYYYKKKTVEEYELLRETNQKAGSVIISKWKDKDANVAFSKEAVENAEKRVREIYGDLPEFIQSCLVEKWLALKVNGKDRTERHKEIAKDSVTLKKLYDKVRKLAASDDNQQLNEEFLNSFLLFLYTGGYDDLDRNALETISDDDLGTQFEEFLNMMGIVDEIVVENTDHAVVKQEKEEFINVIQLGFYTKNKQSLRKMVDERKKYFTNLNVALNGFEEGIKETNTWIDSQNLNKQKNEQIAKIEEDGKFHLLVSLKEYYLREIYVGQKKAEDYKNGVKTLLQDPNARNQLATSFEYGYREIMNMQTVSQKEEKKKARERDYYSVTEGTAEKKVGAERSRRKGADIKKRIEELAETTGRFKNYKPLLNIYQSLKEDERNFFYMALSICKESNAALTLTTAKLLDNKRGNAEDRAKEIKTEIENFCTNEEFKPNIDFEKVEARLFTVNNEVDWKNFEYALSFTRICMAQRSKNEEKDWEKMADATTSINTAVIHMKDKNIAMQIDEYAKEKIDNPDMLKKRLTDILEKESKESLELIEPFLKSVSRMRYLILALQNRTYMDMSTSVNFFDSYQGFQIEHTNEEGREKLRGELLADGANAEKWLTNAENSNFCTKAFRSLLSFQLKDDVSLLNRELNRDDFVHLNRKTVIDLDLLKRATEFADELEMEKTKLDMVRKAPELIKESGNKKAIKALETYEKEVVDEDSFVKFLTVQSLGDEETGSGTDEEAVLFMASYHSFTQAEKELFIKVLQNRDLLDVSKKNQKENLVGLDEREYVNAAGRNMLLDEYLGNSYRSKGRVELSGDAYKQAFKVILSQQIDDTDSGWDLEQLKENMKKTGGKIIKRSTAVDWKLIGRAVQFVKRASDEEIMYKQDKDLYFATGDIEKGGAFQKGGNYMRRNLHRSGNAVSRYVSRLLLSKTRDMIPSYFKPFIFFAMHCDGVGAKNEYNHIIHGERKKKETASPKLKTAKNVINFFNSPVSAGNQAARDYMRLDLETKTKEELEEAKKEKEFEETEAGKEKKAVLDAEKEKHKVLKDKVSETGLAKKAQGLVDIEKKIKDPLHIFYDGDTMGNALDEHNQAVKKEYEEKTISTVTDVVKGVTMMANTATNVINVVEDVQNVTTEVRNEYTHTKRLKAVAKGAYNVGVENAMGVFGAVEEGVKFGQFLKSEKEKKEEEKKAEEKKEEKKEENKEENKEDKKEGVKPAQAFKDVVAIGQNVVGIGNELKGVYDEGMKVLKKGEFGVVEMAETGVSMVEKGLNVIEKVGNVLETDLVKKTMGNAMDVTYTNAEVGIKKAETVGRTGFGQTYDHIKFGKKIVKVSSKILKSAVARTKLTKAEAEGAKHENEDEQKRYKAVHKLRLSKDQQERIEANYERNANARKAAIYGARKNANMDIAGAIVEGLAVTGDLLLGTEKAALVERLSGEAMKIIRNIRMYVADKNMARKYYGTKQDGHDSEQIQAVKQNYKAAVQNILNVSNNPQTTLDTELQRISNKKKQDYLDVDNISRYKIMKGIYGFQSETEFNAYSCLSIIHSLLYSASSFGESMKSNQIVAVAVLKYFGAEDCIGKVDNDSAMKVFHAIKGADYI